MRKTNPQKVFFLTLVVLTIVITLPLIVTASSVADSFKDEVLRLTNLEREKIGVAPLQCIEGLDELAQIRANESKVLFSHTRPSGDKWYTVFNNSNLDYKKAGENLAYGFTKPDRLVNAWMKSPSHKANLLNPEFENLAVGYVKDVRGRIYVSQLFFKAMPIAIDSTPIN